MAGQSHRKRSSEAESTVETRPIRVRRGSEPERAHRTRRRRSHEDQYVYEKSRKKSEKARPSTTRRATEAGETNRRRAWSGERESARRGSERRSSRYQYERTLRRESLPLRSEKRSISDAAARGSKGRPIASRSTSLRDPRPASTFRPSLLRSHTTSRKERPSSHAPPPSSYRPKTRERAQSISGHSRTSGRQKRPSSIFGSVMSGPRTRVPEKQVECLTCLETLPASETAHLSCDHRMCNTCLRRIFDLSVTDPQHMPPKCCQPNKPIPIKHVEKLYGSKFKKLWNQKNLEYRTKNRIYCVAKGCGTWIKPDEMKRDSAGRKYAKCSKCSTKVCCTCNGKYHTSRTCPKDPESQAFAKIAKENGWVSCYNCKATVELKEGCNHMTCRCRAEFCYICGEKWKTCDCPWFNYDAVENDRLLHQNDRLNHMRVPEGMVYLQPPQPPQPHRHIPAMNYQREMDLRRAQEHRDELLAHRVQILDLVDDNDDDHNLPAAHPFMNNADHYRQRARDILAAQLNPGQRAAAERLLREVQARHQAPPNPHRPQPDIQQQVFLNGNRMNPVHAANLNMDINMAPRPPAPPAPPRRANTTGNERVVPRRQPVNDYHAEAARHRPVRREEDARRTRESQLAGITRGAGMAEGRVDEWRRHVRA